mgnify:CR=1 FL=1
MARFQTCMALVVCIGAASVSAAMPASAQSRGIRQYGIGVRGSSTSQSDSYNLRLSRTAASSASSGGLTVGGCLSGCANAEATLSPMRRTVPVTSSTSNGSARTSIGVTYMGFGLPSGYAADSAASGGTTSNETPLGATVIEVSSVATANPAILQQVPNIDPAALAAVNAALVAAQDGGEPADSSGAGTFACQLDICSPEETRAAAEQGLVPVPRYNEAYTNFQLVQEVESTDIDFINNFAAANDSLF